MSMPAIRTALRDADSRRTSPSSESVTSEVSSPSHMRGTPPAPHAGQPALPPPGDGQGLLGPVMTRLLERRLAPFGNLIRTEIAERRATAVVGDGGLLEPSAATGLTPQDVVQELTIVTAAAVDATASGLTSVLEPATSSRCPAHPAAAAARARARAARRTRGILSPRRGAIVIAC
jgi:hypothetical protein